MGAFLFLIDLPPKLLDPLIEEALVTILFSRQWQGNALPSTHDMGHEFNVLLVLSSLLGQAA
ncbi:hypothetical protein [Neorhodopirellula pilleata]|uniref:hypothetical protein n=1 Tax=Neorhodopirellula pilleata TaxID=2714738 RepID=UPI0011B46A02|nr:hypothetical protein [Neorhodopirellula pilleata]